MLPSCAWCAHRSEEISQARLNKMRGVTSHDRIDEELYQDYETEDAKQASTGGGFYRAAFGCAMLPPHVATDGRHEAETA